MLILRSLAFNLAYYLNLVVWMILCLPVLAAPRRVFMRVARLWARSSLWLLRVIAGTRADFRGLEKIPAGGMIVASKHQSLWETFALLVILDDPAYVLKRELMWIPVFGWYAWKARSVPVDRKGGAQALKAMITRAREEIAAGRQIIIFPEGTRRPPGAPSAYKFGVAHLYAKLRAPCLPVALNSGLYWPRRKFIRHPGTIVVQILDPIGPGMPRGRFFEDLQARIETATDGLLQEAGAQRG
ncbi:MAG: 1-acyl-sn-glycerol-3-phosphate acyltransferase [Saliniramus fredricksonii]|uniref:1-acyl-sn-glycerol-3-phosphate acyltransferase n=1 Tax=Saliniramus fredricksonii TaxID=1653334 RepID=A0A0P7XX75_9HYPH|nr:lysophospholipid acyltransferase family protein [Saliniramus fredricksonii]KPQ12183.1 MAG: 1-acyl-sn-glycerol-3-phosphate acyltransferase [Saliniramus fredricksonii]SCC78827.1 1-acyl-sn-glycerol-3-phosphate acyltransferase [Saliniramus fredricksonii]